VPFAPCHHEGRHYHRRPAPRAGTPWRPGLPLHRWPQPTRLAAGASRSRVDDASGGRDHGPLGAGDGDWFALAEHRTRLVDDVPGREERPRRQSRIRRGRHVSSNCANQPGPL